MGQFHSISEMYDCQMYWFLIDTCHWSKTKQIKDAFYAITMWNDWGSFISESPDPILCCYREDTKNWKKEKKKAIKYWTKFLIEKKKVKQYDFHTIDLFLKCRVGLLTAQKPINRPGWWKGKFAVFQMRATGGWWHLSKGQLPLTESQWGRAFIGWKRGLHAETVQSALTVIFKLVIDGLTSIILVPLGTVNIHFQSWFVLISLRPILGIAAAYVTATVWSM